jgi:transposase
MDDPLTAVEADESAHTTDRKSARSARVEIITRGERRRSWTLTQKQEIVAESFGPELTPAEVARKHGIGSGQLYTWRRQLLGGRTGLVRQMMPRFAAVAVEAAVAEPPGADPSRGRSPPGARLASTRPAPARAEGVIEIVRPDGVVVRVDAQVDGCALRRVLGALEGR